MQVSIMTTTISNEQLPIYCCNAICKNGFRCPYLSRTTLEGRRYCRIHYNYFSIKNETCSICLESLSCRAKISISCGHNFHVKCLTNWARQDKDTCPNCRCDIDPDMMVRLNRDVLDYLGTCIFSLKKERRRIVLSSICDTIASHISSDTQQGTRNSEEHRIIQYDFVQNTNNIETN